MQVPPGVVELNETIDVIRQRHCGEGYLHLDDDPTVYSRDRRLRVMKSLMVTRLLLYQNGDYGTVSNEQRQR
jgi:hypothetical protein